MVSKEKLRKIMKEKKFRRIQVPSGKGLITRYVTYRIPYSSAISESTLIEIIKEATKNGRR